MRTTDVLMVTMFTDSTVPDAMAFRIFQDMRGVQATYRITDSTTTRLVSALSVTDEIIYVENASALGQPKLEDNIWGVLTIDGERIMYREIDYVNNTVSGLRRGTAGTAISSHAVDALVYNLGRGNLLPIEYQNYIDSTSVLADGQTTVYDTAIDMNSDDSTVIDEAVEVYIGGTRQSGGYVLDGANPLRVVFNVAPPAGQEVTILVRRGVTWYQGTGLTPSNGVALQDTNTQAARFLRGL